MVEGETKSSERRSPGVEDDGRISLERERRLVLAILEEAVRCYQRYAFATNRRGRRLFGEIVEWLDERDAPWIFSFENICHALDIDAEHIREGLARWKKSEQSAPRLRREELSGRRVKQAPSQRKVSARYRQRIEFAKRWKYEARDTRSREFTPEELEPYGPGSSDDETENF